MPTYGKPRLTSGNSTVVLRRVRRPATRWHIQSRGTTPQRTHENTRPAERHQRQMRM